MQIKRILNRDRASFTAVYECVNCGYTCESGGYDDPYFHRIVIPDMECPQCGEKAGSEYQPYKFQDVK